MTDDHATALAWASCLTPFEAATAVGLGSAETIRSVRDNPNRPLVIRGPRGRVNSIWSWFACAPPKDAEKQWKPRRSALELARAWCAESGPTIPEELVLALDDNPLTRGFTGWDVEAEYVTDFDGNGGEGRNHDLLVVGEAQGGATLVSVEAKATEPFGDPVQLALNKALARSSKSKVANRIDVLSMAVIGRPGVTSGKTVSQPIAGIGYQLFTAAVGSVVEAGRRHCKQAVLLVHRFVEPAPTRKQAEEYEHSSSDLAAFRQLFSGPDARPLDVPGCVGPFRLQAGGMVPDNIDLFLAHTQTVLPHKGC